jgi:restriction endonuclease S subunit
VSFSGTLGELCTIEKGTSPTLKTEPGQYPLVVTAEYRRSASTYQFDQPAVCIPLISSTGHGDAALHRIHYEEGRFALANLLVALSPRDPLLCSSKYLYLLLQAQKDRLLVPLMRGTANVSLKEKDIASVPVTLPPLSKQLKIVEWIDAVVSRVEKADSEAVTAVSRLDNLLMSAFREITNEVAKRPLEEIAPLTRRPAEIDPLAEYPGISTRSFGRGTFHNPPLSGSEITWQKPYQVKAGDILVSNIKAWEGAIAVVNPEDDGRFGSHRYLTFAPKEGVAAPQFVCFYLLSPEGLFHVGEASPGSADRNRTTGSKAMQNIPVPVPPFERQLWFDQLYEKVELAKRTMSQTREERGALLPSILGQVFQVEQ